MRLMKFIFILIITIILADVQAQNTATVYGKVYDKTYKPIEGVNIIILGQQTGIATNSKGEYELKIPANTDIVLVVSFIGYKTERNRIGKLLAGTKHKVNVILNPSSTNLPDIEIKEERVFADQNLTRIDPKTATIIPSPSGGVEALLKSIGLGVTSNNELSSQYNVRGGNFDENLVYVNDVEIYRPFLVRSGQQEGMSFVNSDLISSILFSAGGFEARYGDKMSSVLDIQYKKPIEFGGSIMASLLGESAHLEGVAIKGRLSYLIGARHKTNKYLLKSLDTKGDYKPSFTDIQTNLTYNITENWEVSFLGNYSNNLFRVVPQNRQTQFGTLNEALKLTIYFDGQEVDKFETYLGALSSTYKPTNKLKLKFIASGFRTHESESYDIMGQYRLDELENDFGRDQFGNVAFNRGVGTFLNHSRNTLNATVFNGEHKGYFDIAKNFIQWGIRMQHEIVADKLNEWKMVDSAGYSLPRSSDSVGYINSSMQPNYLLNLQDVVKSSNHLSSNRLTAYIQNTNTFYRDSIRFTFNYGVRCHYWDVNKQFIASPRIIFTLKPNWKKDIIFKASAGYYVQPPFYREIRDMNGKLHKDVKAQESYHFLIGSEWTFKLWKRPFKFVNEIYYKYLDNLITYEIDNVRIRYYANNKSHGYSRGVDMKINGEFVKNIESWASLSVMQTREDIEGDYYYKYFNKAGDLIVPGYTLDAKAVDSTRYNPGYIPRPTDQLVNFSLFFQDYLPKFPTYKMHLMLVFGSSLPFGPPTFDRWRDTLRMPPYRRVDIGFSKQLKGENKKLGDKNPLRFIKSAWVSLEVFNLLQINNTISYLWIQDVTNREYAVPNYLTPRQLNLKFYMNF